MSLLGQLLILIGADTTGLEEGTKRGKKKLSEFEQYVRNARKEMRFFKQAAAATGAAVATAWATQGIRDQVREMTALRNKSIETGKSIEELSQGLMDAQTVQNVARLADQFERISEAAANVVINFGESSGWTKWLGDRLEEDASLLNDQDTAKSRAEAGSAGLKATIARETAEKQKKEQEAARQAAAAAKAFEESRVKVWQDVHGVLSDLQRERDKLAMPADQLLSRDLRKKGALPFEIERALALRQEIDAIKAETERKKEAKKRAEELDKWQQDQEKDRAQAYLDEMHKEEEERKKRMEQAADIVNSRGGIGAAEKGTQAAFSAINKQRVGIEQKQLGALQRIDRGIRDLNRGGEEQTVDSL